MLPHIDRAMKTPAEQNDDNFRPPYFAKPVGRSFISLYLWMGEDRFRNCPYLEFFRLYRE